MRKMKECHYRIIKKEKGSFYLQYKKWYGWEYHYYVLDIKKHFDSEVQIDDFVKSSCELNPNRYWFIKHPMLYVQ